MKRALPETVPELPANPCATSLVDVKTRQQAGEQVSWNGDWMKKNRSIESSGTIVIVSLPSIRIASAAGYSVIVSPLEQGGRDDWKIESESSSTKRILILEPSLPVT